MGPGVKTPSPSRGSTAQAILKAASRRYGWFGPRKTTMDEVARDAGCSRATLYAHFPSKEALYTGLLEHETQAFLRELGVAVASSRSAREKLREIVGVTARVYAGKPVLRGALTGDTELALERVAHPVIERHEKQVVALLRRVLEDGIAEGTLRSIDAGAVAYLMYELGRVLVTREVSGQGKYPFGRILAVMDDLVARGIAKPGGKAPVPRSPRRPRRATSKRPRGEGRP